MCENSGQCESPTWDASNKTLIFPTSNRFARGLTKTLAAQFSPNFSIREALRNQSTRRLKRGGKRQGNLTDKHLTSWANEGKAPKSGKDLYFDEIQKILNEKQWIPIAAQFPVGCEQVRLATKIDLLCKTMQGTLVVVELKCGFDTYFDVQTQGNMKQPFQDIPMSCRNMSYLQLSFTTFLFRHCHHRLSHYVYEGSFLVHIFHDKDGKIAGELSPLPVWGLDDILIYAGLDLLKANQSQTKQQRESIIRNGKRKRKRQ